ncbi:MAG: class I SAM-dependent methyltransferase [Bacteroidota bacterium]
MEDQLYQSFYDVEMRHWWFVARREILLDIIETRLHLPAGSKVLDVGCGVGGMLVSLSDRYEAYGTDTSTLAIEFCRKRGLKNVFECDLKGLPLPNLEFDLIMLLDVIEHVDDDLGLLREAFGRLKKGGIVLVTVPAYQFLWTRHDDLNHHKRRYVGRRLGRVLVESGFLVDRMSYFNTLLFPLALVTRLLHKVLGSGNESELSIPPSPLNNILKSIFSLERPLLRRLSFWFGLSILAIARKH